MIDWTTEWPLIQQASTLWGVNAYFVAAIRQQENGAPGKEFGVLSVSAPTYEAQLRVTCISVAHRMSLFNGAAHQWLGGKSIMSSDFIQFFASVWAPYPSPNDPTGLNKVWAANVTTLQSRFAEAGGPK